MVKAYARVGANTDLAIEVLLEFGVGWRVKTLLCLIALAVAYPALSKSVTVEIGDWRARILDEDQFPSSNLITVSVATEGRRLMSSTSLKLVARGEQKLNLGIGVILGGAALASS